jgi:hypothetical protein
MAVSRLGRGYGGPLAILLALGVETAGEVVFDWRYPMVSTSILLIILLLSIAETDGRQPDVEEPEAAHLDRGAGVA